MTQIREKRVGYKVATRTHRPVGQRGVPAQVPSLDISGQWFAAAGFRPGDAVTIQVEAGQITIRKRA
jgi:hypothetical protein